MNIEKRLAARGLALPEAPRPAANYVPYVIQDRLLFIAGQIAFRNGEVQFRGRVPDDVTLAQAQLSAQQCALNILAVARDACSGDLSMIERCIRVDGFVRSADDFFEQATVINGASDVIVAALGPNGRHARTALGVNVLPLEASVEINAIFAMTAS